MEKKKKSISLKRLLILSFATIIVVSGISIASISYLGSRNLGFNMASQIMKDNSTQVLNKVIDYLGGAYYANTSLAYQIESGIIDIDNPENQESIFENYKHYLELYPEFVGLFYGDETGRFLFAKKMPDDSVSLRIVNQENEVIISNWEHQDSKWYEKGYPNSRDTLSDGYDPRRRTWYKAARASGKNTWSDVYIFSSDKKPGITNAQPIFDNDNYVRGIFGIDIGIIDISYYLNSLDISKSGQIVILDQNKQIVAFSSKDADISKKLSELPNIENFYNPVIRASYNHYNETKLDDHISSFKVDSEKYVTTYIDFPADSSVNWQIGIIMPEEDILGIVYSTNRIILYTALFFIILSTLIGFKLSGLISKPLALISQNMRRIRKFDLEGHLELDTGLKELQEISSSFSNLKNGMRSFSKYVPSKVVAKLVSMGREAVLGGEKRKLTVFFSDIAGFTDISEDMEPEHLVEELADYLGNLSELIQEQSGTVDKYIGDSIMAFWNAPDDVENHAVLACEASIKIQQYLTDFKRNNPHRIFFPTRIGINTGEVLVGNIGSAERMNYTVMGDNINLGSRLESLNKYYGTDILVSEQTVSEAGNSFVFRPLDKVTVKGKSHPIMLYELLGYKRYQTKEDKRYQELYHKGLECYFNAEWDESLAIFNTCLISTPEDIPCQEIIKRIEGYKINPPPEDWNGVFIYLNK
ncbi:MAG: cache domain-containing protein [Spirochaetaceae bacterium]